MHRARARFVLLAGSVFASAAAAAPTAVQPSLYGLTLGRPIELSECEKLGSPSLDGRARPYRQTGFDTPTCFKHVVEGTSIDVHVQGLTISKNNTVSVLLRNGWPDRISVRTEGVEDQDDVLRTLTSKFGKPRKLARPRAQNRMGAVFRLIEAEWRVGSASLSFSTNTGSTDSGVVELLSSEAVKELARQARDAHIDPRL